MYNQKLIDYALVAFIENVVRAIIYRLRLNMLHQLFIAEDKPLQNNSKGLFFYSVRKAKEKGILYSLYTHNQWANLLFSYEKRSSLRVDYMSKIKSDFKLYFTTTLKYGFETDKIERDFPQLFGKNEDNSAEEEYTCSEIVEENIKSLDKEIIEQNKPENIEQFKGVNMSFLRRQGKSCIYSVRLVLSDGQEPHFHDGIPFTLKVYGDKYICEAIDFDYEAGLLFFTSTKYLNSASYCSVLLESSFILEELRQKLISVKNEGVNDDLPFTKFFFDETTELKSVPHARVPYELKKGLDALQAQAFDAAIDNDITFIWGPPRNR